MKDYQLMHDECKKEIRKYPICLLANDINVPMNIGNLFRMADALGVQKIFLCGTSPVPPNKKINRSARATVKIVDYEYQADALEVVRQLKSENYTIVSLEITKNSLDILDFRPKPTDKICLIIGSENTGVSQDLLDASDVAVHIQMYGQNSSMNVAMATTIAVFELIKYF